MTMLKRYTVDLHIHSVLSPCGDLEMSPSNIVRRSRELDIDLIAITDHNMVENCIALSNIVENNSSLNVFFGMEINTQEEVHLLCLFDELDIAIEWQEFVYENLPDIPNDVERFGYQVVVDEEEQIIRTVDKLLISSTSISVDETFEKVSKMGGLVIPSHVDRPVNSIISQLGFIPLNLPIEAVEVSLNCVMDELIRENPEVAQFSIVRFSDAHYLDEIGRQTTDFFLQSPTVSELKMAFKNSNGRKVQIADKKQRKNLS